MKKFVILLFLLTGVFVVYQQGLVDPALEFFQQARGKQKPLPEQREIDATALGVMDANATQVAPQAQPQPLAPAEAPTSGRLRITCPACKGQGRYLLEGKGRMSRTQACLVCGARGFRSIFVPPHGSICGTCSGMGRRFEMLENGRMTSSSCQACVGRGYSDRR